MWAGGATGLTGSGLSLVGRLLGSREFAGYMWAAMIVWGGPVLATTVLLLVGRLWGRQGAVNIGMAAGAALGAWQWDFTMFGIIMVVVRVLKLVVMLVFLLLELGVGSYMD